MYNYNYNLKVISAKYYYLLLSSCVERDNFEKAIIATTVDQDGGTSILWVAVSWTGEDGYE